MHGGVVVVVVGIEGLHTLLHQLDVLLDESQRRLQAIALNLQWQLQLAFEMLHLLIGSSYLGCSFIHALLCLRFGSGNGGCNLLLCLDLEFCSLEGNSVLHFNRLLCKFVLHICQFLAQCSHFGIGLMTNSCNLLVGIALYFSHLVAVLLLGGGNGSIRLALSGSNCLLGVLLSSSNCLLGTLLGGSNGLLGILLGGIQIRI